ncbi:MotA/TolQ/ExbB proton channel family protein [Maribellus sp. YY47]|uniref:MotA/TolQ/ExbB proton channel family protein n=1 Tax=Maribellus sp. YY47 TaxID=2929486 RepID=UPI0020011F9D|nr:MotA/TolQ/ExbB proton channel family protein [Maribellus sp. YY47]MCK3684039.1 MotA/TolQ/ExbB proton channel family protein [Maribellus sp. YY47]
MKSIIGKFIDGGPAFTVLIFACLIIVLILFTAGLLKKESRPKLMELIKHIGWFAVAWGFMGRTFGLIHAFDAVSAHGELTPSLLAEGLKMALVDPLMGIFVFVIARLCIIVMVAIQKR